MAPFADTAITIFPWASCLKWLGRLCGLAVLTTLLWAVWLAAPAIATTAPDWSEQDIEAISTLRQQAFAASQSGQYEAAEDYWGQLLDYLPEEAAIWSNRGLVRAGQLHLDAAIEDYTQAIALAPAIPDAYLNRGAAYEMKGSWDAAIADYNQVLALDPNEAGAYNNRGNAEAGLGDWAAAIADYQKAADLDPEFALARVNYGLALYQAGDVPQAIKTLRSVVRRYPNFPDARAALTGALWVNGQKGEAESHWVAVSGLDNRYRDLDWLRHIRRWPPTVADALAQFLALEG
jgi:tetratricopeptide (TPR) repeat protein